jgi:hypothetical protein
MRVGVLSGCLAMVLAHVAWCAGPGSPAPRTVSTCKTTLIGVDPTLATTSGDAILGWGWGQTFIAVDTLIQSVTVWRIKEQAQNGSDMQFLLTETEIDSLGVPNTAQILQSGPVVSVVTPDTSVPTPIRFEFDPPLSLPAHGRYCFWIKNTCTGYFDLLLDPNDDYPGGHAWRSDRSNLSGCGLQGTQSFAAYDMAFLIEFCDSTTPTRAHSWGALKLRYR